MPETPWTIRALKSALDAEAGEDGELNARIVEGADPVLLVTMRDYGDLEIFVSISDQQIAASVLLWPVDEQADRHAFNEFLLKAQKLVPLSNFGISTVSERDYYELFGELSTTSSIGDILTELRVLADNAIEAASDLRTSFTPPEFRSISETVMSIWRKLFTLGRAGAHEAAASVIDVNAIRILDQEIRDADTAQGKARDDLATLVARRRILEKEVSSFRDQITKYEGSARAAVAKGDMDLARQVAQRIADLEQDVALKSPQIADMRAAEDQLQTAIAATDRRIETLRREVEVVKVNESVQRAQSAVAARGAGAGASLGSAADSLARIKERQAIRGERIQAAAELEDRRTGADLDEKLRLAGIMPGQSSADDILARLGAPSPTLQIEQKTSDKSET